MADDLCRVAETAVQRRLNTHQPSSSHPPPSSPPILPVTREPHQVDGAPEGVGEVSGTGASAQGGGEEAGDLGAVVGVVGDDPLRVGLGAADQLRGLILTGAQRKRSLDRGASMRYLPGVARSPFCRQLVRSADGQSVEMTELWVRRSRWRMWVWPAGCPGPTNYQLVEKEADAK